MSDLPKGWALSSIGEAAMYINGRAFKPAEWEDKGLPIIRIQNLNDPDAKYNYSSQDLEKKYLIKNGDLLFAWSASLGAYLWSGQEAWLNQHIFKVEPYEGINNHFLYYLLEKTTAELYSKAHGSGMVHVTKGKFEETEILIPPTNEQERIVAKIEELFSELDKGIESLTIAREQLKIYRQSILKHAFEGKLTEQWREENKNKLPTAETLLKDIQNERNQQYEQQIEEWNAAVKQWENDGKEGKKPTKPRKLETPEKPSNEHILRMWDLPPNWQWLQIGFLAFVTKLAGFEYTKFVKYDENGDLPVLKAENAGKHGFKKTSYSRVKSNSVQHLIRSHIKGGELLVVFVGAGTGNVATVPNDQNYFLGPNIGMVRSYTSQLYMPYLEFFLRSPKGFDLLLSSVKAVAQPSLSMGTIRQTPIALPSYEEQKVIADTIAEKLDQVEKVEEEIETQLQKCEALRQSILKQAFSGKLVEQDPNDEPASVLLERIKAEKQSATKSKKSKAA